MEDRRPELYKLSNQFMELYVQEIFSNNGEDLNKLKGRLTDEQRENLRNSVNILREQVEEFLITQNTRKKVTENSEEAQPTDSPLREILLQAKEDQTED